MMADHLVIDCQTGQSFNVSAQVDGEQYFEYVSVRGETIRVKLPTENDLGTTRTEIKGGRKAARRWYIARLGKEAADLSDTDLRREWICTVRAAQKRIDAHVAGHPSNDLLQDLAIVNARPPRLT